MANCSDNVYVIKYTDKSKGTITITKSSLVTSLVDIALVGKSRLDYGEIFNENMLHLLENFACPSNTVESDGDVNAPDTAVAFGSLLNNPVDGQKWYNTTSQRLYIYNKNQEVWVPQATEGDVAGNSGVIADGEYLPRPVFNGYVFPYAECNFVVSQHSSKSLATDTYLPANTEIDYMKCFVEASGRVTMRFRYRGESSLRSGYANYQIIGIRGESNTVQIEVTPYVVPAPTPNVSATNTPTPTPTPSVTKSLTPTPSPTKGITPTPTPTKTMTPTPTVSLTRSVTPTPTVTPTPSISVSATAVTVVNLQPNFVTAGHPEGFAGTAVAGLRLNSDGIAYKTSTKTGSTSYTWLSNGLASNYQVYATITQDLNTGGTISGPVNSWVELSSSPYWAASIGPLGQNTSGTIEYGLDFQIRRKSDNVVVENGSAFLYAYIGNNV